jgi:hypothetical protein
MKRRLTLRFLFNLVLVLFIFCASGAVAHPILQGRAPAHPPQNHVSSPSRAPALGFEQLSKSSSGQTGLAFLPGLQVNIDPGNQVNEFAPVVAASKNGNIYIVWNGDETVKSIFFSRSTDGGHTFSPATRLNDSVAYPPSYSVYQPDIALDSAGNILVVWHDYRFWADDQSWTSPIEIFMDKSTDGGLTWNTDIQVSTGSGTYPWHSQPSIAVDGKSGNIYVSFTDYDRYSPQGDLGDISVSASRNNGASFEPKVRADDTPDSLRAVQTFSSIAYDAVHGRVVVAFNDNRNGSTDIVLARSADSARTFLANVLVNQDTTNDQEEPSVAVSHTGDIHVVWKDWSADSTPTVPPYDNDMLAAKSTDGGLSFAAGVKINDTHLNADYGYNFPPRLALDGSGVLHVTWFDMRLGYTNCFYDKSVDGGLAFSQDVVVNDNRDSLSHSLPRIAVGNGRVYIVYMDKRNGNGLYDIFFTGDNPVTSIDHAEASPTTFSLEQNYPNPFNPTTNIRFQISEIGYLKLVVYDLLGREVRVLADGETEPGVHQVSFDGSGLASGTYFYRLQAGASVQTRRMVLMK